MRYSHLIDKDTWLIFTNNIGLLNVVNHKTSLSFVNYSCTRQRFLRRSSKQSAWGPPELDSHKRYFDAMLGDWCCYCAA